MTTDMGMIHLRNQTIWDAIPPRPPLPGPAGPGFLRIARLGTKAVGTIVLLLMPGLDDAWATAVCGNELGQGNTRIECTKASGSSDDIDLDITGIDIDTTANSIGSSTDGNGVTATHAGTGDIDITIGEKTTGSTTTPSTIDTTGNRARGIVAKHSGTGVIGITLDDTEISTVSNKGHSSAYGLEAEHTGDGNITVDLNPGVTIDTQHSLGVRLCHASTSNTENNITLTADDITVNVGKATNVGSSIHGIYAKQESGNGHVRMTLSGSTVTTHANHADGIYGWKSKASSTGDVEITFKDNGTITTSGDSAVGIRARNDGAGDITVDVRNGTLNAAGGGINAAGGGEVDVDVTGSSITTTKKNSTGVSAEGNASSIANIDIDLGNTNIDTSGLESYGIQGNYLTGGSGALSIGVNGGSVTTSGNEAYGIYATHSGAGDIDVTVGGRASVTTTGEPGDNNIPSVGIFSWHDGSGDTDLTVTGGTISTSGQWAHGIYALSWDSAGTYDESEVEERNDINLMVTGGSITTGGLSAHGVFAYAQNIALDNSVAIELANVDIKTESTALDQTYQDTFSVGVYGRNKGPGNLDIDIRGGSIVTKGLFSYGIYARHDGTGNDITVTTRSGHSVTTEGGSGHGIVAYHFGSEAERTMAITVGGPITVNGAGAQGVRVGVINDNNYAKRVATLDDENYRRQTVTVNGPVMATAEGVRLAGGGKVIIGPGGSIRSGKGIAILATGGDENNPSLKPKLRVDLNLGGRRVSQALGDDWILNDGGETTIAMNGVVLHDGATGVTENTARNGSYNVRMVADGVKVTVPANLAMSELPDGTTTDLAEGITADRDFSAADFSERRRAPPPPPPPPPEPDPPSVDGAKLGELVGGVVADALGSIISAVLGELEAPASPSSSPFIEVYAPRAAVYEALPTALLSLNDAGQGTGAPLPQGTFTFARTLEDHDGLRPADSTVGQRHALGYGGAQFGRHLQLGETLGASAALHRVWSTVDVEAGTGGGEIGVEATGLVLNGAWDGPEGFYAKAGLSMTHYKLGTWSEDRDVGMLAGGIGARGSLARIEAGREVSLSGVLDIAPRVWFKRSALSVDDFTDAVGSRVSIPGTSRVSGGVGLAARAERRAGSGTLSLRGSVDLAHVLDGRAAVTDVSGARLTSQAEETELRLALSGVYRQGRFSLAAEASLNGADPGDARGAVGLRLSASF